MTEVRLKAVERTGETPNQMRRTGAVPAVVYGRNTSNVAVKVDEHEITVLLKRGSLHTPFTLELPGGGDETVMLKEVQRHPAKGDLLHIDFLVVDKDHKITSNVALHIEGEDKATKGGGILQHQLWQVNVECLPQDLPESITLDISNLSMGDVFTVEQITPPAGVTINDDPSTVVLSIVQQRRKEAEVEEEESEPAAEAEQE